MNKTLTGCLAGVCVVLSAARGQGTFQNLDFEAAQNLPPPGGAVATTDALPGWTAFSGTNPLPTVHYNSAAIVYPVALYVSNSLTISGSFSVFLYNGGSIRQTGLVPNDSKLLLFKERVASPQLQPLVLSLGGQSLSYATLFSDASYTLYGADISGFAGQTHTLVFQAPGWTDFSIDDIEFSQQVIPEPSLVVLLSLAGLLLAANRFIRKRKA